MKTIRVGLLFLFFFLFGVDYSLGASCESPKFSSSTFSTTDSFFHFSTTLIVEFSLTCANNVRDMPVFAIVNGRAMQAAISEETAKYQVSWQEEHSHANAQTFNVDIFDEDGYSTYRKAERNQGDMSKVKPLFTVELKHPGVSTKSPVSSEIIATALVCVMLYIGYTFKQKLS